MKLIFMLFMIFSSLVACNLMSPDRRPAQAYEVTDRPVAFGIIKFQTIEKGLHMVAKSSSMIKSIDHFSMDPITRRIRLKMTVNYPLESLFTFSNIPDQNKSDLHEIDITISLPETKNLAYTRYLGLQFHHFKIDGDEYISAFPVVVGAVKTLLANSDLVNYLYTKTEDQLQNPDHRTILREILDNNGIFPVYGSNKINFKVNLAQFQSLSPFVEDYKNLNLWRFSPTLFQGEDIRFNIIAGEGEPSDKWMESQQAMISEDSRTLRQVREDLYVEYSRSEDISQMAYDYMKEVLAEESIVPKKLDIKFQNEMNELLDQIQSTSQQILSRDNENFIADPEFEYLEYISHVKNRIRNYVAELDRRLTIQENILAGGSHSNKSGPLVTQLVSENLINGSMNFLIDYEYDKIHFVKEIQMFLDPKTPGVYLTGKINLPLDYVLGQMDSSLLNNDYESKITEIDGGIPVRMHLEKVMKDNGVLGLELKSLQVMEGSQKIVLNRNSKNQAFMLDMLKLYVAQLSASENYLFDDEVDAELKKQNEIESIKNYVAALKEVYESRQQNDPLFKFYKTDLEYNPFIVAGKEHVQSKKEILFGDFISFNEKDQLFETKVDASIVMDSVNNVKLDLQLWDMTPLYSKELGNNFLRLDVGNGVRSRKFIDEMHELRGQAENSRYNGIYYELGKERTPVDLIMSLDFNYLESYINNFLQDMVIANSTNIVKQAEAEPGKTFYEIGQISLDINSKEELVLDVKIKSAKKSKGFLSLWGKRLVEDTYSISAKLEITAHEMNIENSKLTLEDIRYYPNAIAINPTQVKIKAGKPSLIDKALTGLINSTANLAFNNKTVKKLLLKIANKFLGKMYKQKDGVIQGHEIEKSVRVYTTSNDILLLINPRVGGASYDLHLTGKGKNLFEAIKLDHANKKMHIAFTASIGMAKMDKKHLIGVYKGIGELIDPMLNIKNAEVFKEKLLQDKIFDKLINRSDAGKEAYYRLFTSIMSKYEHVLHTTNLPGAEQAFQQKISATASELIYFASISDRFDKKISALLAKMEKFKLTDKSTYYQNFKEARDKMRDNVTKPLLAKYKQRGHLINQAIINNKISYWTYLFYADAYFAEMAYRQMLQN